MQEQFNRIYQELMDRKREEQLIEEKKEKRKKRKRQPITLEIYEILIKKSNQLKQGRSYRGVRLRLALALLAVTGIRVSELLPVKMKQIETLFVDHWIAIDRAKKDPSSHKAFLTREGARVMRADIFTAENANKFFYRFN